MAKIVFFHNIWYEQQGLMYLSSYLKLHGHHCELFLAGGEKDLLTAIERANPDIIGTSIITGSHIWALKTACQIKKKLRVPIILGGPHPTFYPEVISDPNIDMICRGEGEKAILELLSNLDQRNKNRDIKNIWFKENGKIIQNDFGELINDLDALPFPDRSLYQKYRFFKSENIRHLITSRGCPHQCSYCFNYQLHSFLKGKGKYVRQRSVENVIAELKDIKEYPRVKTIYFGDDILLLSPQWTELFLSRYKKEIGLPFICNIRPDGITDNIAEGLREAGCITVQFGVECGKESTRKGLLRKNTSDQDIIDAANVLRKYKLKFLTFNMLGLPHETVEDAFRTLEINARIKTSYPRYFVYHPYPRTTLGDYAIREGLVGKNYNIDDFSQTYFKDSPLNQDHIREIINLHKLSALGTTFPWLKTFLKMIIKLPPNISFEIIYLISLGLQYSRCTNLGLWKTMILGMRNISNYFRKQ
ncbi:MAG: B12-binding domain-containing radical SAM protein [Deltaproteobacteria bacterium]|nr:MAG: B12-binding domain-containing radical SAM protein [Deltaproteobacteria bacterium]